MTKGPERPAAQAIPSGDAIQPDGTVRLEVERDPGLDIATVDMTVIGFLGRDYTVSGFAAVPRMQAMYMSPAENVVGPGRVDVQTTYRETCSLRMAPAAAGQLAAGLIQAIKDSSPTSFIDLQRNLAGFFDNNAEKLN